MRKCKLCHCKHLKNIGTEGLFHYVYISKKTGCMPRLISSKFLHMTCWEALLTRISRLPYMLRCFCTTLFALSASLRSKGNVRHLWPSFSIIFFVSLASCSRGKYTMVISAPSRAYNIATLRPIPELYQRQRKQTHSPPVIIAFYAWVCQSLYIPRVRVVPQVGLTRILAPYLAHYIWTNETVGIRPR